MLSAVLADLSLQTESLEKSGRTRQIYGKFINMQVIFGLKFLKYF